MVCDSYIKSTNTIESSYIDDAAAAVAGTADAHSKCFFYNWGTLTLDAGIESTHYQLLQVARLTLWQQLAGTGIASLTITDSVGLTITGTSRPQSQLLTVALLREL